MRHSSYALGPPRKKPRVHSALGGTSPKKTARQTKRSENGRVHLRKGHDLRKSVVEPEEWTPNNEVERWEVDDGNELVDVDCDLIPASMRTRYTSSDDPMLDWVSKKQEVLDEFMRMEGQSEEAIAGFCQSCRQKQVDKLAAEGRSAAEAVLTPTPTRYKAFLRMIRQYRHIMLLKRAGRGNINDGVSNIAPGELALTCIACPQPGVNLPTNWMSVATALSFLYTLYVSLDANFRLKNRLRNNDNEAGLHTGLAYFVQQKPYNEHILKHASEADISSCSGFNALARADSKSTSGLRYTGVGMCVCSRHELIRPLGVGDLQKGERYCNMDFVFLSAISGTVLTMVMAIYDIACQWKANFAKRMSRMPAALQLRPTVQLDFAIPKCHCPAHKLSCQTPHSLNLKPGAGRTDGEGIERDWSMFNPAANSTKEMGMGSRHDTLDDLFAYHNWQKTAGLGLSLKRKYLIAAVESKRHTELHREFSEAVPLETQREWTTMIIKWERDNTMPNPYVAATKKTSCYDALERIRLTQRAKRHVAAVKKKSSTGQRTGAQIRGEYDRLQAKIDQAAAKYRAARLALVSLVGETGIPDDLRVLQNGDIRPPPAFEPPPSRPAKNPREAAAQLGEGYRELPWIWRTYQVSADETSVSLNEGLRIEWAKSRARCLRWTEELLLLKEEMRRARVTLRFRAEQWIERSKPWSIPSSDPILNQGRSAYAARQASVHERLLTHFTTIWSQAPHKRSAMAAVPPPGIQDSLSVDDESLMTDRLMEAREIDAEEPDEDDGDDDSVVEGFIDDDDEEE
ncbi:hypothetical protein ONZ45_g15673 [Pleurotus djamor]|nr:hypothetical protein ONZ45_g15673 [Pleurotus djamor]